MSIWCLQYVTSVFYENITVYIIQYFWGTNYAQNIFISFNVKKLNLKYLYMLFHHIIIPNETDKRNYI